MTTLYQYELDDVRMEKTNMLTKTVNNKKKHENILYFLLSVRSFYA